MPSVLFNEAQRLIETGRFAAAARSARTLLADEPRLTEGWLLLALAEQRQQRFDAMLAALHTAMRLTPTNVTVLLKFREAQLYCGLGAEARSGLAALERGAQHDAFRQPPARTRTGCDARSGPWPWHRATDRCSRTRPPPRPPVA
jgi:predicted Zn-dependent protease